MKKKLLIIITLLTMLFIPNSVFAEEANVIIKSIEKESTTGNVEEIDEATVSGTNINLNLKFKNLGDSIVYKIILENKDNEEYALETSTEDEYISYTLSSNIIKKNTTTEITLTAKYNKEIPENLRGKQIVKEQKLYIQNDKGEVVNTKIENIINPKTGRSILLILIIILISVISLFVFKNKKKKTLMILLTVLLLPASVFALKKLFFTINITYEIEQEDIYTLSYNDTHLKMPSPTTQIGEFVSNEIPIYNSSKEAINAWKNYTEDQTTRPFYLKHILDSNNKVKESYAEFVVTQEMSEENPGMVPGTYSLRGAGATSVGTDEWGFAIFDNDSPYYEENVNILKTAFDYANHRERCIKNLENGFSCRAQGLRIYVEQNGNVNVEENNDYQYYYCQIDSGGSSLCAQTISTQQEI